MKDVFELDAIDRSAVLGHFRGAVRARITQWDHEGAIEKLLDGEINIDFSDIAAWCDDPATLSLNDFTEALKMGHWQK